MVSVTSKLGSLYIRIVVAVLLSQSVLTTTSIEAQKNFYSPDPHTPTAFHPTQTHVSAALATTITTSCNEDEGSKTFPSATGETLIMMHVKFCIGDRKNILHNWNSNNESPCGFVFVFCSGGSVSSIMIRSRSFSGILSPWLANLTNLQTLIIRNTSITGPIPSGIWMLRSLQTLDLSNNFFVGQVPTDLSHVPSLTYLDLSNNNLTGHIPKIGIHISVPEGSSGYRPSRGIKVVYITLACLAIIAAIAIISFFCLQRKRRNQERLCTDLEDFVDVKQFTLEELEAATNNFCKSNLIGKGSYATVFKGLLKDGTVVAVKKLKDINYARGVEGFKKEVEIISQATHRHILPLLGVCVTATKRLLIYPYMPNETLASRLAALDWESRKRIAVGVARALHYLHQECKPKIIHRDVKPDNVLLDDKLEAVVADFGLIKLLDHEKSFASTSIRGTPGYIAPEYLSSGTPSEKCDVYAFGIILLELISGRRIFDLMDSQQGIHEECTFESVKRSFREESSREYVDPKLESTYDERELVKIAEIALSCIENLPTSRPKMAEVVKVLSEHIN